MPTVKINGMRCGHCVGAVTKAISEIDGVKDVSVSLENSEATFEEEKPVDIEQVKAAITKIGFEPV